jgi:hypothetical protein
MTYRNGLNGLKKLRETINYRNPPLRTVDADMAEQPLRHTDSAHGRSVLVYPYDLYLRVTFRFSLPSSAVTTILSLPTDSCT